ncbi:hypothetical protein MES4922_110219 [Mesorhizobium ventifaucium]|uniref:Uncharacterized protein n=1 Tax=Mesorhizobium ventifaucium TaxID=666020 RepID=A0ABN8JFY0_9HYPH|nr:hypothetical protein MES4922_110219 [Mesorhizobium ventifaucium]
MRASPWSNHRQVTSFVISNLLGSWGVFVSRSVCQTSVEQALGRASPARTGPMSAIIRSAWITPSADVFDDLNSLTGISPAGFVASCPEDEQVARLPTANLTFLPRGRPT